MTKTMRLTLTTALALALAGPALAEHGGKILARGGRSVTFEGTEAVPGPNYSAVRGTFTVSSPASLRNVFSLCPLRAFSLAGAFLGGVRNFV